MEVKIGYHFAFMLTRDLLIDSPLAIGLIITLPTPERHITLNFLLGSPDFTGKLIVLMYSIHVVLPFCCLPLEYVFFGTEITPLLVVR